VFQDKRLTGICSSSLERFFFENYLFPELAVYGIGVHHAGLSLDDRRAVESLFLNKQLKVVVATSTLAVGVNLRKISTNFLS
jgi:ATP-dependent DNA helicase HFM1/MER3